MINALFGIGLATTFIYNIFVDGTWAKIYFVLFCLYLGYVMATINRKQNPKRKTLLISTWTGKLIFSKLILLSKI